MNKNPLLDLEALGQSIWLDYLRRSSIDNGELLRWIEQDGVSGITSNPSIFEKAIAGSHDYDNSIRALSLEGKSIEEIYQSVTVEDIQRAADLFRRTYDRLQGSDGFVSLEVSPALVNNTEGTIAEARRLWGAVKRPNVFIKVPATEAGIPAIRQLIGEGINVNITLLFGLPRYRQVVEAYLSGLEMLEKNGQPLDRIASVASFFLSRIDVLIDPLLEKLELQGGSLAVAAAGLHGEAAIASAKVAYQIYKEMFFSERFKRLAGKGAHVQRLLWASTSTKNPAYSDVKYVEPLIDRDTINTVPIETLDAYRDHGQPHISLEEDLQKAKEVLSGLKEVGIDLDACTQQLEDEGAQKFSKAYDQLMGALKEKREASFKEPVDPQTFTIGKTAQAVQQQLNLMEKDEFVSRFWRKDPSLWKSDPGSQETIKNAMGWLHVAEKMQENLRELEAFKADILEACFEHVVVLGMGGSSLTPLVFERTFGWQKGALPLTVLDSTHPEAIHEIEQSLSIKNTLFIISSKSGTTAEPLAFGEYFYEKVQKIKGDRAGENFCVITDPGTPLVKQATERHYRKTFLNYADIGGRYSALSYFGLVPAALMGVDVEELVERSLRMVHACAACVPVSDNPGVKLGVTLGILARDQDRYKVTFLLPEKLSSLGMWLEQLLAESTGKEAKGLLPVAGEPLASPADYDPDRIFVNVRLKGMEDGRLEKLAADLGEVGHPVVDICLEDLLDLGQEFFRWEIATAVAGAILGIDPFDQPNVQESKDNTNRLLALARESGKLSDENFSLNEGPLAFDFEGPAADAADLLCRFLTKAGPENYLAIMAYLPDEPATQQTLEAIRKLLLERLHLTTTLGFGPRFLHSTGQFHKGGPNTGLFLQVTAGYPRDLAIPGVPYTFGTFISAQARGDLEALRKHGRKVLRIDLGPEEKTGLESLVQLLQSALEPEEMKP